MKICMLDAGSIGRDLDLSVFGTCGEFVFFWQTLPGEIEERIADAEVVLVNKVRLDRTRLAAAGKLLLICIAATGYDNIDVAYCRERGIAVCNVAGYSTQSVAQLTFAMALQLVNHLPEYTEYVRCGAYSAGTAANRLEPTYHELGGSTWGIVGYGNIGRQVAQIARSFGCRVLINRQHNSEDCVPLDTLCRESDVISLHVPLTDRTRRLIDRNLIASMKRNAILINVARGAVCDEEALVEAVAQKRIGGIGVDVYTSEPLAADHPYMRIAGLPNVCLTPHMAWGAYEARVRCVNEMVANIRAFCAGERRNRVD